MEPPTKKFKTSNDASPFDATGSSCDTMDTDASDISDSGSCHWQDYKESLQMYAFYSRESLDGTDMYVNTMAALENELFVSLVPFNGARHSRVVRVGKFCGNSFEWIRGIVLYSATASEKIVKLRACPSTGALIVLTMSDPDHEGPFHATSDIYSNYVIYQVDRVTGDIFASCSLGRSAYRTVTFGIEGGHLLTSTCGETGEDVRLVEIGAWGTEIRQVRLNGVGSHRLLSNFRVLSDNETFLVSHEMSDEGPEVISLLRCRRDDDHSRQNWNKPTETKIFDTEDMGSYTDMETKGMMVLDIRNADILILEITNEVYRLRVLRYYHARKELHSGRVVGILGAVSDYKGPYVACYDPIRGALYWQSHQKFQVFHLW